MNDDLYKMLQQISKSVEKYTKDIIPTVSPALQEMCESLNKRMEEIKPKAIETIKALIPYIEILPSIVDQYVCSSLASTGFVMVEEPDQEFLNGFAEMSKSADMIITEDEEVEEIIPKANIDSYLNSYLLKTKNKMTEKGIDVISAEFPDDLLWKQSLDSYRNEDYALAILGFAALGDRLMSLYSGDHKTSINNRVGQIVRRAKTGTSIKMDRTDAYLINTYESIVPIYDAHVSFDEPEPDELCRHWIMHGRWKKPITQLDCIKVLHIMFATIAIGHYSKETN